MSPVNRLVITNEDVRMFHELCAHIYKAVYVSFTFFVQLESQSTFSQKIWPNARFAALGAFVFLRSVTVINPLEIIGDLRLRFISPVIVSPSEIDVEIPQDNPVVLRQGLMMIAKIIQTLANNVLFGREVHMSILNSFLESKIMEVLKFLSELSVCVRPRSANIHLMVTHRDTIRPQMMRRKTRTNGRASPTTIQIPSSCIASSLSTLTKLGRSS